MPATDGRGDTGTVTMMYVLAEVPAALAALTGEPHPLAADEDALGTVARALVIPQNLAVGQQRR